MKKRFDNYTRINNLKDMLNKSVKLYSDRLAYKVKTEEGYREIKYAEVLDKVNVLGTELINMGLKGKRIAVIGENRYEWEIAYLSVVCGTGVVTPLDKALPENEIESLIERSQVEAIFFSNKYEQMLKDIKAKGIGKLKYLISMDLEENTDEIYSQLALINKGRELINNGDRSFIDSKIDNNAMSIMLFTSGTTSKSKVVALSHKNICSNLMDLGSILKIDKTEVSLSLLPLHHVFECVIGFLLPLYIGGKIVFCDGLRHIVENLNEYKVTIMSCVPILYEQIYKNLMRQYEKAGQLENLKIQMNKYKDLPIEEKARVFKTIHDAIGCNLKYLFCAAAALDKTVEQGYRDLGFGLIKGYGLTETSPAISAETEVDFRVGSVGRTLPSVEAMLINVGKDGIGELVVKGPNVMLGYYDNKAATDEVLKDGWFNTGDLAKIDKDGYIFICGRKKNVIVLKNGKNIFPEEMENLVNRIQGVKESFIYGKQNSDDKDDIKINAKIVYDKEIIEDTYKVVSEEEIYDVLNQKIKELNKTMPLYKSIRGISLTEVPLIKTTTSKIKRQEEIKTIQCN